MPEGDRRHRINVSSKFYVAQLLCGTAGCHLNVSETAERVRYKEHGRTVVQFNGQRVVLRPQAQLASFVQGFIDRGVYAYVGGVLVQSVSDIKPADFIYLIRPEDYANLNTFHPTRR